MVPSTVHNVTNSSENLEKSAQIRDEDAFFFPWSSSFSSLLFPCPHSQVYITSFLVTSAEHGCMHFSLVLKGRFLKSPSSQLLHIVGHPVHAPLLVDWHIAKVQTRSSRRSIKVPFPWRIPYKASDREKAPEEKGQVYHLYSWECTRPFLLLHCEWRNLVILFYS